MRAPLARVHAVHNDVHAPVLLASAFDPGLARRYGQVIGREGRALGQDVLLSPMINLIRTPYAGRNFETFSEDPLPAGDMVAAEIKGIQGEGLIATVKHFARNNQEKDRDSIDVLVGEQTMHEVELEGVASRPGHFGLETPPNAEQKVLARQMVQHWGSFIRGAVPRADGQPAMLGRVGAVLSLRTASRGGNTISTIVHREHRCDLWDAAESR